MAKSMSRAVVAMLLGMHGDIVERITQHRPQELRLRVLALAQGGELLPNLFLFRMSVTSLSAFLFEATYSPVAGSIIMMRLPSF